MKVEEATDTIAKFFNDLIGAWVPGAILATGLAVMHLGPIQTQAIFKLGDTTSAALTFAGSLFAAGHALLAVHEQILKRLLVKLRLLKPFDEAGAKKRQSYDWFSDLVKAQRPGSGVDDWSYKDLRSVALSVSSEAASVGRRFMFISLLCTGVGTSLAILATDFAVCCVAAPNLLHSYAHAAPESVQIILLLVIMWTLLKQGEEFYSKAMATPFSIAVAVLKFKKEANAGKARAAP